MVDVESAEDVTRHGRRHGFDIDESETPRLRSSVVVVAASTDSPPRVHDNVVENATKCLQAVENDSPRKSPADTILQNDSGNHLAKRNKVKGKDENDDSRSAHRGKPRSSVTDGERRDSRHRHDRYRSSSRSSRHSSSSNSRLYKSRSESRHLVRHSPSRSVAGRNVGFKKPPSPTREHTSSSSGYSSRSDKSRNGSKKASPPSRLGIESEHSAGSTDSRDAPQIDRITAERLASLSTSSALAEVDELEATSVVRDILKMFDDLKTTIKRAKSPSNLEEGEVLDEQEVRMQEAKLREVENLSLDEMLMRIVAHVDEQDGLGEDEDEVMSPVSGDDAAEPGEITVDDERQEERWKKKQAEREASRRSMSSAVDEVATLRSERRKSPVRREKQHEESMDIDESERERLRSAFKASSPSAILRDALDDVEKIIHR